MSGCLRTRKELRRFIEATVRELFPPVFLRSLRRLCHSNQKIASAGRCVGDEQGPEWYDGNFELHEHWRSHYSESPYYFLWAVIADRIVQARISSVLEMGCGAGQLAALLGDKGISVYYGVDFSARRIEWARRTNPSFCFILEDIFQSDVLSRLRYEAVICTEFLEHIESDLYVIREIAKGTRFFGTVPNFPYISHVRYFRTLDEVSERYGEFFDDFRVDTFLANGGDEAYFLIDGARNVKG